jgi:glutamate---cysteine ligase / carboxylate-amine ligase
MSSSESVLDPLDPSAASRSPQASPDRLKMPTSDAAVDESTTEAFSMGVEEEYQIINPSNRELYARAEEILPIAQQTLGDEVQPELKRSQIEIATPVCQTLAEVRDQLNHARRSVIQAAATQGARIAAAGTHPFSHWCDQPVMPKERYQGLLEDFQQLAREMLIWGCHVHVGIRDREMAVQVMNRARYWMAPLLALTANSPFWLGADTGYDSYRTLLWSRWPMSGLPPHFDSDAEYRSLVQQFAETGCIEDATKIYWDIRLSERFPTIEFRVSDVCMTVDEAVMLAGLIRALAHTCYEEAQQQQPSPNLRPEVLRFAHWRSARYGLSAELMDGRTGRSVPAPELIQSMLEWLRPVLESHSEWVEVSGLVNKILTQGTGAARQRAVYQQTGRWEAVVDRIIMETAEGLDLNLDLR